MTLCSEVQFRNILWQFVTDGNSGSVMLCKDEQLWNIFWQFVAEGRDGSVTLCNDEQLLNIFAQLVTDGSEGNFASISAMHELNRLYISVTATKSKCDKSAYFKERHIWNVNFIDVTNEVSQSGVISRNLPQP